MAANKVHFGLKRACYSMLTETVDPDTGVITSTYGPVKQWPGAVSLDMSSTGDLSNFYADDGTYYTMSEESGYEGDFESASIPDQFRQDAFGDIVDDNGALIEGDGITQKYFAFGFETSGDVGGQRVWLYKCKATRPNVGGQTKGESPSVDTKTVNIVAIPRADETTLGTETKRLVQARAKKDDACYANFFSAVYAPSVS